MNATHINKYPNSTVSELLIFVTKQHAKFANLANSACFYISYFKKPMLFRKHFELFKQKRPPLGVGVNGLANAFATAMPCLLLDAYKYGVAAFIGVLQGGGIFIRVCRHHAVVALGGAYKHGGVGFVWANVVVGRVLS